MCNSCEEMYVPYHIHSSLSNPTCGTKADCVTNYDLYLEKAKEMGIRAFGFSEHGNILNHVKKKEAIEKAGMKYIHGVEAYLTENIVKGELKRDNYHWVMIAKNYDGFLELNKLVSTSFNKDDGHFYFNPRISFEEMMNTSDNIIMTTACLGSPLWKMYKQAYNNDGLIIDKERAEALSKFLDWIAGNKHRVFFEIQYHNDIEQVQYNQLLLNWSREYNVPLIAGTDTHALDKDYAETRKVFLKSKNADYGNEDAYDLTFKSYDGICQAFEDQNCLPKSVYIEAIQNTNVMSDMIERFEHDDSPKYPKIYKNPEEVFKKKVNEGFVKRGFNKFPKEKKKIYLDRIAEEFEVYKITGTFDYMLLQAHILDWCHDNDIMQGYGRGSVNGSIIAYMLGITEMDSIKHGLNFFRFINPERVSLPDIDIDFPPSRRSEVIEFISSIEGIEFCEIITINSAKLKRAIRDLGKGLNMSLDEVDEIAKAVETFGTKEKINNKYREAYPELFAHVDRMSGCCVSVGAHPSGYIVSPISLDDHVGTMTTQKSIRKASQLNMKELDGKNYIKLDILGLINIELINEACKLADIERLTPDNIDINDIEVWKSLKDSTLGIFQFEGFAGTKIIEKLFRPEILDKIQSENPNISYINLLSMANGAIRPAGDSYRDRLADGQTNDNGHEALNELLGENMGYLLFQEDIMKFLTDFCGFSGAESDTVRRGFAKKTGTGKYIPKIHDGFMKFMTEHYGENEEYYEEILKAFVKVIEDSSDYGFSLNHSQPYSYIGYAGAYLRYHYPLQFLSTLLDLEKEIKEIDAIISYAKNIGVKIQNIAFGKSRSAYSYSEEENAIYKGIKSIKYMNAKMADELFELANSKEFCYTDAVGLFQDIIENTCADTRQISILINLDYFKKFGESSTLLEIYECMVDIKKADVAKYPDFADRDIIVEKKNKKGEIRKELKTAKKPLKYTSALKAETKEQRLKNLREYELAVRSNPPKGKSIHKQILFEKETLGYSVTTYPELAKNIILVIDINTKYTPVVTMMRLNNGETITAKVKKGKMYDGTDGQFMNVGDVIKITDTHFEGAWKMINNKWVQSEIEDVLFLDKIKVLRKGGETNDTSR